MEAILRQDLDFIQNFKLVKKGREALREEHEKEHENEADELMKGCGGRARRSFEEARNTLGSSSWLSAIPFESMGLEMDRQTFRDAVALRMGVPFPDSLHRKCPSCGEDFSLAHALKCKHGGWVYRTAQGSSPSLDEAAGEADS